MIRKFRKKPVIIEAVQWLGNNWTEIVNFAVERACEREICWYEDLEHPEQQKTSNADETLIIHTLEGDMLCSKKDWIIRGVSGELYPCKPDIFEKTYEEVFKE